MTDNEEYQRVREALADQANAMLDNVTAHIVLLAFADLTLQIAIELEANVGRDSAAALKHLQEYLDAVMGPAPRHTSLQHCPPPPVRGVNKRHNPAAPQSPAHPLNRLPWGSATNLPGAHLIYASSLTVRKKR